jgi:hypothetical protein
VPWKWRLAAVALAIGGPWALAGCGGADHAPKGKDAAGDVASDVAPPRRAPANHRAAAVACPMDRPAGTCPGPNPEVGTVPDFLTCTSDDDCSAGGQNGRCQLVHDSTFISGITGCECSYDVCFSDADCDLGGPCGCRIDDTSDNRCWAGNCKIDADCGAGGYCSLSPGDCLGGFSGYYCRTSADACVEDADCGTNGTCRHDADLKAWTCVKDLSYCAK